jgi:magnesium-transporting ATPase (P-type)
MSDSVGAKSKSEPAIGSGPGADGSKEARTPISPTIAATANAPDTISKAGLTNDEARRRLQKFGPNAMPDTGVHPLAMALDKFWAPVPWMLEAAIVLELVLGKYIEAAIIALLLVFNAALGLFQESRAQATLAALKSRLALTASVKRDGAWKTVPATDLAPGDLVKLSLGGVVAADVKLTGGEVLLDQSMLTGESVPIEAGPGLQTYAGALVRRGEAEAEVTATGVRTKFGRTAELVGGRPCREHPAEGGPEGRAQSRRLQRRRHPAAGGLFLVSQDAGRRHHPPRSDGDPGVDTRGAPRHLYPRLRPRRTGPGEAGHPSHTPLGRR